MKVRFTFTGFFAPVDNMPTVNSAKAGNTIPVKFSLAGDRGLSILDGAPKAVKLTTCGSGLTDRSRMSALSGGLTYDASTGQYQYNWKTAKGNTGCYRLDVALIDGQTYSVLFNLK